MLTALQKIARYRDLIFPIGIISCLVVILIPLPPFLLDIALSFNVAISVVILLTTISISSPLEFSVFPSLLVATTLGRLVLNIATTRLILTKTEGNDLGSAGQVIQAFGEFVAGDRLEVGIVLFVIIFVINFIVITKGATRIGEVAARFALDGMPGRQMAIDADLSAGAINEKEAQRRREELTRQADFYGTMDGASKFVRGDAIAGIIITLINIVGGLYVGTMYAGMTLSQSAEVFTKLTIGDGLVSQVPAFLISLAAALLTTRSTQQSNLPQEFLSQIFAHPKALIVSGAFLLLLMLTQLPRVPLMTMGLGCIGLAIMMQKDAKQKVVNELAARKAAETAPKPPPEKKVEEYLDVDAIRIELGTKLIVLADASRGGDLMKRISTVRATLATEMGILLPTVRIKDKLALQKFEYEIQIFGNRVAGDFLRPDRVMAIDSGMTTGNLDGEETTEPAFGKRAYWIDPAIRQQAEIYGYRVVESGAVLATHLQEVARKHAEELLTRDVTKQLIDQLKKASPTVVDELIPSVLKLSDVQQVLQNLLREDIPIRQLSTILETLGDYATRIKDPIWLTEYVRNRLARTISHRYRDQRGVVKVVTMDPAMEDRVAAGFELTDRGLNVRMSPAAIKQTCVQIANALKKHEQSLEQPILLVSPRIRPALRRITADRLPELRILCHNEITRDTNTEAVGMVSD
jgi:flagellar biosynthesis protein FlhA